MSVESKVKKHHLRSVIEQHWSSHWNVPAKPNPPPLPSPPPPSSHQATSSGTQRTERTKEHWATSFTERIRTNPWEHLAPGESRRRKLWKRWLDPGRKISIRWRARREGKDGDENETQHLQGEEKKPCKVMIINGYATITWVRFFYFVFENNLPIFLFLLMALNRRSRPTVNLHLSITCV